MDLSETLRCNLLQSVTYGESEAQFNVTSVIYTQPWIPHPLRWRQSTSTSSPKKISSPSVLRKQMSGTSPRMMQNTSSPVFLRGALFHHDRADAGRQSQGLLRGNDVCECCVSHGGMLMHKTVSVPTVEDQQLTQLDCTYTEEDVALQAAMRTGWDGIVIKLISTVFSGIK